MILYSPTERGAVVRRLIALGDEHRVIVKSSSVPEPMGVDYAWLDHTGEWNGVQRKEVKDYLASLDDGRLTKEIGQMNASVALPLLVLEGRVQVANGQVMTGRYTGREVSFASWQRRLFTLADRGVMTLFTNEGAQTAETIWSLYQWTQSGKHTTAGNRPKPTNDWGKLTNRDWQVHLLQGLDGVGALTAQAIVDTLGRCPLKVDATVQELMQVPGIGKTKAERIIKSINGEA